MPKNSSEKSRTKTSDLKVARDIANAQACLDDFRRQGRDDKVKHYEALLKDLKAKVGQK